MQRSCQREGPIVGSSSSAILSPETPLHDSLILKINLNNQGRERLILLRQKWSTNPLNRQPVTINWRALGPFFQRNLICRKCNQVKRNKPVSGIMPNFWERRRYGRGNHFCSHRTPIGSVLLKWAPCVKHNTQKCNGIGRVADGDLLQTIGIWFSTIPGTLEVAFCRNQSGAYYWLSPLHRLLDVSILHPVCTFLLPTGSDRLWINQRLNQHFNR